MQLQHSPRFKFIFSSDVSPNVDISGDPDEIVEKAEALLKAKNSPGIVNRTNCCFHFPPC